MDLNNYVRYDFSNRGLLYLKTESNIPNSIISQNLHMLESKIGICFKSVKSIFLSLKDTNVI